MKFPRWLTERDPVWPVLLFAAALRVHWFGSNRNLWPDEASYLLMARSFAGLTDYEPSAARPVLLPLLWSLLFRLGFGEFAVRLSVIALALLGIFWIHRLGREIYGGGVALIAALLLAVSWPHAFFSQRVLTDIPALTLWTGVLWILWRSVVTGNRPGLALWLGPLSALMLLTRYAYVLVVPLLVLLPLVARGGAVLRDRRLWGSFALGLGVLTPFAVWCVATYGSLLAPLLDFKATMNPLFAARVPELYPSGLFAYLKWFPTHYFGGLLTFFLLVGLVVVVIDRVRPRAESNPKRDLLVVGWAVWTLLAFAWFGDHNEARYLLPLFPAIFFVLANGVRCLQALVGRYSAVAAAIGVAGVLAGGGAWQLAQMNTQMKRYAGSYMLQRSAGEWLGANALPGSRVFTTQPEIGQYYSGLVSAWYPESIESFESALAGGLAHYLVYMERGTDQPAYLRAYLAERGLSPVLRWRGETGQPVGAIYAVPPPLPARERSAPEPAGAPPPRIRGQRSFPASTDGARSYNPPTPVTHNERV